MWPIDETQLEAVLYESPQRLVFQYKVYYGDSIFKVYFRRSHMHW